LVRPDLAEIGTDLTVHILGEPHKATVLEDSPFDPGNTRLRA
jgi:dimethylglycine dehydrogenase